MGELTGACRGPEPVPEVWKRCERGSERGAEGGRARPRAEGGEGLAGLAERSRETERASPRPRQAPAPGTDVVVDLLTCLVLERLVSTLGSSRDRCAMKG